MFYCVFRSSWFAEPFRTALTLKFVGRYFVLSRKSPCTLPEPWRRWDDVLKNLFSAERRHKGSEVLVHWVLLQCDVNRNELPGDSLWANWRSKSHLLRTRSRFLNCSSFSLQIESGRKSCGESSAAGGPKPSRVWTRGEELHGFIWLRSSWREKSVDSSQSSSRHSRKMEEPGNLAWRLLRMELNTGAYWAVMSTKWK